MHTLLKKSLSLLFALTLLFSPLAAPFIAPKAEAQLGGAIAGCLGGYVAGLVGSFLSFLNVPVDDTKNNIKECIDAIAFALAKTLLAKMTDSIINWINNGFDGNPFYIGDTGSFFKNVIRDELQLALDEIKRTGSLYFEIARQQAIYDARLTLRDVLKTDLDSAIITGLCGYAEYELSDFCTSQLTPEDRAELTYAFTRGYIPFQWSTWDSLTQNCGNNIFCANSYARDYIAYQKLEELQQLNTTLNRSGGFLDQKVCSDPGYERDLEDWQAEIDSYSSTGQDDDFVGPPEPSGIDPSTLPPRPVCPGYIIQTPGRIIADKLTSNLGTTERQLELADELNESIAAIFDALINKLISDGLKSFNGGDGNDDDAYYQSLYSDNNGFEYERTEDVLGRDQETCDFAGGVYDEELEVCDFEDPTGTTGNPFRFPITMSDGTILQDDQDFAALINANPQTCIELNGVRVKEGAEPCLIGVSNDDGGDGGDDGDTGGGSDATLSIEPSVLVVGNTATFIIRGGPENTDFEILYLLPNEEDPEFLIADVTDADGSATASMEIPDIDEEEITIILSFGDGSSLEQSAQVSQ